MSEAAAETLVLALGIYALIGLLVGLIYVFGGAGRIDPAAKGKGLPFRVRLLVLPGIAGLWPLMLIKLFTQKEPPVS
ncbi:MAG: hypothetical protein NXH70_10625 [Hyphomonas sp.]|jgi:hypothetical protein|nr:hypothetical protein [Henriciella sp.]MBO6696670.1 hypothetical protein [Henriciella sp.]MCR9224515.1 hypothetical protein [Hyphomonas sp.]